MNEPAWAIVQSRTRCEDIVERGLQAAGYRTYVPRFRVLTWPHGQRRKPAATMRALFSGLVFVQDWRGWPDRSANRIPQIVGLMKLPGASAHATVGLADIAKLMRQECAGMYDPHAPRPPANGVVTPAIEIGEQVEYDLAGQAIAAVLRELSDDGRATIGALIFGRETRMQVEASDLRIAG